jgi:hypothetical protein
MRPHETSDLSIIKTGTVNMNDHVKNVQSSIVDILIAVKAGV